MKRPRVASRCRLTMLRGMWRLLTILMITQLPTPVGAYDMTRRDRLNILYSNQVVFDRKGEPLVSVRISEGQKTVRFRSRGRVTLLPGGDDASQVRSPARTDWEVRLESSKAGTVRWWSPVERIPANDMSAVVERRDHWRKQGHTVKLFEAGALIGLAGQTLDTRSITVGLDPVDNKAAAEAQTRRLRIDGSIRENALAEPLKRPTGWLIARESRTGIEIRTKDLLWLSPRGRNAIEFPDLEWGHGTPKRGRMKRTYEGDLYITIGRDGRLAVVNVLSAERLLEGVVPSELFPSAPLPALRAQAVAARGQLLAKVGTRHRSDPYLLCAETHCQVYSGTTRRHRRTTKAVKSTRGQLLFHGPHLVDTTYSSACGGHSEAFHLMWGGKPKAYSMGIVDVHKGPEDPIIETQLKAFIDKPPAAFCSQPGARSRVFRWRHKRSGQFVTDAVNKRSPIGPVHTIKALRRGHSGRALAVEYVGPKGRYVLEGSYNNRKLMGGMKSGMWVVKRRGGRPSGQPGSWHFTGGGFGHGVGMCQHGAIGMARDGREHEEILKHYYRGSSLRRAW